MEDGPGAEEAEKQMTTHAEEEALKEHIAWCRAERAQALNLLESLAVRGLRTWEQCPGKNMVETTDERVAFLMNIVAAMDRLLAAVGSK